MQQGEISYVNPELAGSVVTGVLDWKNEVLPRAQERLSPVQLGRTVPQSKVRGDHILRAL